MVNEAVDTEAEVSVQSQEQGTENAPVPAQEALEGAAPETARDSEIVQANDNAQNAAEEIPVDGTASVSQEELVDRAVSTRNAGRKRWYIVQAHTNFEKKVAAAIVHEAQLQGVADLFEEVVVPTEEVIEMRRGKKVQAEKRFFPGYVLAKMVMNDTTWQLVNGTDKVVGFLGAKGQRPQPITEAEANAIFQQVEEGVEAPRNTVIFDIGEEVKVIDGPFDSFIGVVDDIDEEREKLKVSVSIFGRATPVELNFDQVQKA